MNAHRSSPLSDLSAGNANDAEALRVLDSYLSGIEAGRPADPHKLLADHPALADQLRAYLKVMHLAGRMAEDSATRSKVRAAVPYGDGRTPALANGREGWSGQTPPIGTSHLSTLDFGPGPPPHIQLRELLEDRDPLVLPRSAEMPDPDGARTGQVPAPGAKSPGAAWGRSSGVAMSTWAESWRSKCCSSRTKGIRRWCDGSSRRRKSAVSCSIPVSCRCTRWELSPTGAPTSR